MSNNKYTVTLEDSTADIINSMSEKSGIPAAKIIRNLLMLNSSDLYFFSVWFGRLKRGTDQYICGRHTLMHPGPGSLMRDARQYEANNGNKILIGMEALAVDPNCEGVLVVKADNTASNT
ncbi:hypothetical protein GCM10011316_21570 [Roseibium aquae]|uniref:Uncharacterized protein n=1 Tax=Roseibium aquae TaxID=1323746 RepID=A0A916TKC4_9HYPH|nr:hypothetical protein [Roseibium aquae]GGB49120.1 hypothetical protein GCM10011316_21570 [Roseibium aquae]